MAGDPAKHSVSRRQFLKVAAGGIAGAAVLTSGAGGVTSLVAGGPTPQVLLKDLKKSAFAQHLGEDFKIRKGLLETVDFKLIRSIWYCVCSDTFSRRELLSGVPGPA